MEVVIHIEGTFTMMESLKPHVLIVRASISAQWHFAMLCEVARNLGIPSIEIQHGVFSVSEDSLSTDHAAEFIAEYGPIERELWHAHQYAPRSRAIDIGSPRFDAYHSKNGLKREEPLTVLHIAPQLTPGEWIDSYEVFTFFKTMADAAREIPGIHVIIKLRAGDSDSTFFHNVIKRTFGGVSHEIASREPLLTLLDRADIVVSCHSTAVHEALAARRPVILDTTLTMHKRLVPIDFGPHIKEGAVLFADGSAELSELLKRLSNPNEREALSKRAAQFMEKNYLFSDGKSSLRLADAIRDLVKSKNNLKPLLF